MEEEEEEEEAEEEGRGRGQPPYLLLIPVFLLGVFFHLCVCVFCPRRS